MAAGASEAALRATTALVLAGGAGTRLRSVVADRPKPLAPVAGEPFVLRVLDQLAAAGAARTVLCTGHLGERFERELGREHEGMELVLSREDVPLGTAGALRHALPHCAGSDAVLVLNGDSYCHTPLGAFAAAAAAAAAGARGRAASPARAALVAVQVPDASRFGTVALCADEGLPSPDGLRRVERFVEKDGRRAPGLVNAGVYAFARSVLEELPAGTPSSLERDVLPRLAREGLLALPTDAPFLDIGTPESFATAAAFFDAVTTARAAPTPCAGLLVLDRDGTLIEERHYLADPRGVALLPGVAAGLRAFRRRGYALAVVTNQSGIGRGLFDEAALAAVHDELAAQLRREGVELDAILHCPHRPEDACACRKPGPALLQQALRTFDCPPSRCLVVGDKACDVDLGRAVGARTALVRTGYGRATEAERACVPDLVVDSLAELARQEVRA